MMLKRTRRSRARGLGSIAVVGLLVVGSLLAATLTQMSTSAARQTADEMGLARARAAADAAIEWGRYKVRSGAWAGCSATSATLDLRSDTGMYATVTCNCTAYSEGYDSGGASRTASVCELRAVACNSASCPDNAAATSRRGYAEWERSLLLDG